MLKLLRVCPVRHLLLTSLAANSSAILTLLTLSHSVLWTLLSIPKYPALLCLHCRLNLRRRLLQMIAGPDHCRPRLIISTGPSVLITRGHRRQTLCLCEFLSKLCTSLLIILLVLAITYAIFEAFHMPFQIPVAFKVRRSEHGLFYT